METKISEVRALADAVHRALDASPWLVAAVDAGTGHTELPLDLVVCLRDYRGYVQEVNGRLESAYGLLVKGGSRDVLAACEAVPPLFACMAAIESVDARLAGVRERQGQAGFDCPPPLAVRLASAIAEAFPGIEQPYRRMGLASDEALSSGALEDRVARLRSLVSRLEEPRRWLNVLAEDESELVRQLTSELQGMRRLSRDEVTAEVTDRAEEIFAMLRGGAWLEPLETRFLEGLHGVLLQVQVASACRELTEAAEAVIREHGTHGCRGIGLTLAWFRAVLRTAETEQESPVIEQAKEILRTCREEEVRQENDQRVELHRGGLQSLLQARIPLLPRVAGRLLEAVSTEIEALQDLVEQGAECEDFSRLCEQAERKRTAIRKRLEITRSLIASALVCSLVAGGLAYWARHLNHKIEQVRALVATRILTELLGAERLSEAEAEWEVLAGRHRWLLSDPLREAFVEQCDVLRGSAEADQANVREKAAEVEHVIAGVLLPNAQTLVDDGNTVDIGSVCEQSQEEHERVTRLQEEARRHATRARDVLGDTATEGTWRLLKDVEDSLRDAWTTYEQARRTRVGREADRLERDVRAALGGIESATGDRASELCDEFEARLRVLERCDARAVGSLVRQEVAGMRGLSARLKAVEEQVRELDKAAENGLASHLAALRRQGREVPQAQRGVSEEALQSLSAVEAADQWAAVERLWSLSDPVTPSQARSLLAAIDANMLEHPPADEAVGLLISQVKAVLADIATPKQGVVVPLQSYLSKPSLGPNRSVLSLSLEDAAAPGKSLTFYSTEADARSGLFFETETQVGNFAAFARQDYSSLSRDLKGKTGKLTRAPYQDMCDDMRTAVSDVLRGGRNVDQGVVDLLNCLEAGGQSDPPIDPLLRVRLLHIVVAAASELSSFASSEALQVLKQRLERVTPDGLATWVNPIRRDSDADRAAVEIVAPPSAVARVIAEHGRIRRHLKTLPAFFKRMRFVGWLDERRAGDPVTLHLATRDRSDLGGNLVILVSGTHGWDKVPIGTLADGLPRVAASERLRGTYFGRPVFLEETDPAPASGDN